MVPFQDFCGYVFYPIALVNIKPEHFIDTPVLKSTVRFKYWIISTVNFVSRLLERVYSTSGTERKKTLLERFIRQWRDTHQKIHSSDPDTTVCDIKHSTLVSTSTVATQLSR